MAKPIWDNKITKATNWNGDATTDYKPVSGKRVQEFVRDTLESKMGVFYYDEEKVKYLVFADEQNRDTYLSDRTLYADLLLAQFDAPAPYSIQVYPVAGSTEEKGILAGTTGNVLQFNYTITDSTSSVVRDSVQVVYTFNLVEESKVSTATKTFSYGEIPTITIDDYMSTPGRYDITMQITGKGTGAEKTVVYSWTVIQVDLSTTFNIARSITTTDGLAIPYSVAGLYSKTVEFYIDGVKYATDDIVTDATKSTTKYVSQVFASGLHTLQIRAYVTYNDSHFYSNTLYREFMVIGNQGKLVGVSLDYAPGTLIAADKSNLVISCEQYATTSIPWGYYSSDGLTAVVSWRVDGTVIASREVSNIVATVDTTPTPISFMPTETGNHTLSATVTVGDELITINSYTINVVANTSGIREATDGLTLKLTALGRSNTEPATDRETWTYTPSSGSTITTDFTNVEWSDLSGWKDDALVLSGTSQATINYKPLSIPSHAAVTYGATIEIDFETFNVEDENAVVAQIYAGGHGIQLTATKGTITSDGQTTVYTNYKDGERNKIAFLINPNSGVTEKCLTYIQTNGILERATSYANYDSYETDANIVLGNGASNAGIKVYSIRCYNRTLTTDDEFNNFIIDSTDTAAKVEANDVYVSGTTKVSLTKMQGFLPVLTFTGPMHILFESSSKDTEIHCDIDFVNPDDPTRNFTITGGRVKLQGTSSLGYPRKNFKIYMKKDSAVTKDYQGNVITDWQMKEGAVPCHTFTLKADFSDSSCTHNSTIARLYGDLEPNVVVAGNHVLRTPPQIVAETTYPSVVHKTFPYQLRTTPDSFPMVCFYREDTTQDWTFMGQYNFLNDKGNDYLYGFRSIYDKEDPWDDTGNRLWDNVNTHCFEVLNNTDSTGLCTWTDSTLFMQLNPDTGYSYWNDTFKSRYPEQEDDDTREKRDAWAQSLYTFHQWLASCYQVDNGGDESQAKFDAEYEAHMDKYFFASYYSYFMRFGAVDQVNKNMMMTTYDGVHWFPIRYDNDTILGERNDSRLVYDYTITRQTRDPEISEGYAYAGHSSWLWNALENSTSFMSVVADVDSALYSAGLTYEATVNYFDVTQSNKWCERIYNDNGRYKYIDSYLEGKNYLMALQGKRQSHRHWWLSNRFDLFDAYFLSGAYTDRAVRVTIKNAPQGTTFTIKAGKQNYYGWGFAKTPQQTGILLPDQYGTSTYTFSLPRPSAEGDPVYIYAANSVEEIDIHNFCPYFVGTIDISKCYDSTTGTRLKKLVLGDVDHPNNAQIGFGEFTNLSRLEYLDIRGFSQVTTIDLTGLTSLNTFLALDSGLTIFYCPSGLNFTTLELPSSVKSIVLDQVTWQTLLFIPTSTLKYVEFTKMYDANCRSFIEAWVNAVVNANEFADKTIKLSVPKANAWNNVSVSFMLNIAKFGTYDIRGKFNFGSITAAQVTQLTQAFGENVWDADNPLVFDAAEGIVISCNKETIYAGDTAQFSVVTFPVSSSAANVYYVLQGGTPSQNSQGQWVYINDNVTLYRDTGLLVTEEDSTATHTITVTAIDSEHPLVTSTAEFTINARIYPTAVTITSAVDKITSTGIYEFGATYNPSSYNGTVESFVWNVTTTATGVSIESSNLGKCFVKVTSVPTTYPTITVSVIVTYKNGTSINGSKTVELHAPFTIVDSNDNIGIYTILVTKGIEYTGGEIYDTGARSWLGANELTVLQSTASTLPVTSFVGVVATPPINPFYVYFINCAKLILSLPYINNESIDISACNNFTNVDISGCYTSERSATIPSITLGVNTTIANVGNCPAIVAPTGCKIFNNGEDSLTLNASAITSIEFDNCSFTNE